VLFDRIITANLWPVHSPPVCVIKCVLIGSRPYVSGDQAAIIPKVATQDTTLSVNNVDGGKTSFPVPSGMQIDIHVPGVHYNRTLNGYVRWGLVLMKFRSAVLERATQVHAGTVPWGLAERRVSAIQSRYILPTRTVVITHEHLQVHALVWGDGASCCSVIESMCPHRFLSGFSKPRA
jgi:hypothetical protein